MLIVHNLILHVVSLLSLMQNQHYQWRIQVMTLGGVDFVNEGGG